MFFSFTKDLETGNAQIDSEHKMLINAINDLLDNCSKGKGRAELNKSVEFLSNYVKTHFSHEEALQIKHQYPEYEGHKRWHTAYIADIEKIVKKFSQEGATIALVGEVNAKAGALITHIKTTDSKLAKYIQGVTK